MSNEAAKQGYDSIQFTHHTDIGTADACCSAAGGLYSLHAQYTIHCTLYVYIVHHTHTLHTIRIHCTPYSYTVHHTHTLCRRRTTLSY
jgi:hypothetical protein